jgi:iron complex outermembrane recepter protein
MFEVKPMVSRMAQAFGGLAVAGVIALPAQAQQPAQQQTLERIEITGSNIRRVDTETPQPLIIIQREDIEKSGKTTLNELLQSLPVVSSGSFSETTNAGNSFAPGTASVSLRGLGVNTVLVLLNGRRLAGYGFAQNINEAFVDLNAIPITAIERIDILKDGASAIYGSDAIAGVINVILRKDFRGIEVGGGFGTTVDGGGTEYRASVAAGFGNLATQRFNVMGTLDYFKRDEIGGADRDFSKNPNQEPRGFDFRSPTGNPGTWTGAAVPGGFEPFANCPPERNTSAILGVPTCAYDFAADNWLLPQTERMGVFTRGVFDFTQNLSVFGEFGYTNNVTNQSAAPTPGTFPVAAANPSNPFGAQVNAIFRLTEAGKRLNEIDSDTTRAVLGLKGLTAGIDWEIGANWSKNEVTNVGQNYIDNQAMQAAGLGTGVCARDPVTGQRIGTTVGGVFTCSQFTVAPGTYWNFTGANPASLVNAVRISPVRTGESELTSYDVKGTRELFQLPGGPFAIAAGLEYREESIADTPDPISRLGQITGSGGTSTQGERDLTVGFIEFSVPFAKGWESQFAVRQDDYSDFGSATTGKASLGWRPTSSMLIRGGWGSGFRAPSLVELYLGSSIAFPQVRDAPRCAAYTAAFGAADPRTAGVCGTPQVRTQFLGNPALDAEESDSYTFGFVLEPIKDLSVGVDYYSIAHSNRITSPTAAFLVGNPGLFPACTPAQAAANPAACPVVRNPQNADDLLAGAPGALLGTATTDPNAPGINRSFFNATRQKTWGVDVDLRYSWTTAGLGRFRATSAFTYIGSFTQQVNPGQAEFEYVDTYEFPRLRNVSSINWVTGPWDTTLVMNYVDSYEQFYGASQERVDSMTTFDAQVSYTGFKNTRLTLGGTNIFNQAPPWSDIDWFGYDSTVHSPRGAFWYARATYKF